MPELADVLDRLGLSQYLSALSENGFETWDVVMDVTEEDLKELGFKIGHRRTLQREIASSRGVSSATQLFSEAEIRSDSSSPLPTFPGMDSFPFPAQPLTPSKTPIKEGKRRYRRHPKPDQSAPKKPRTAYVNFADNLRLDPAVSSLSFVDIAREVGRRWQILPAEDKHRWECAAARAMQEYEMQMEEYKKTDAYARYQDYLDDFRRKQAAAKDRRVDASEDTRPRSHQSQEHVMLDRASSGSPMSMGSVTTPEMDKYTECMSAALKSLASQYATINTPLYTASNLPPESLVRSSALTFLTSTSASMFAWPLEHVSALLSRMYTPGAPTPDATSLAEAFALAALGGFYAAPGMSDATRTMLHASAAALLDADLPSRSGYLRTMRLFLCLSYHATLEKNLSCKNLVVAGLRLARWKYAEFSRLPDGEMWRRVYRSLVFLDAWISSTLGFVTDINDADVSNVCIGLAANSADDAIQHYSTSIVVVGAEVAGTLNNVQGCTPENVGILLRKIDIWRRDLHPVMQLQNIERGEGLGVVHRQAAILVHILYLTTILHLYTSLVSVLSPSPPSSWTLPFTTSIRSSHTHIASAARQIAHLLAQLNTSPADARRRWWLRIHGSYTAGVCLVWCIAGRLVGGEASGASQNGVQEDLAAARACVDSLAQAAMDDPAAAHLVNLLRPQYSALESVLNRASAARPTIARGKSSIYALLDDGGTGDARPTERLARLEVLPVLEEVGALLGDLTGRMRQGWRE